MKLFWRQGYEATSVDELVKETSLAKQSLYNSFGNKRDLFLSVFERYQAQQGAKMLGVLEASEDVKEGFRRLFDTLLESSLTTDFYYGCLAVNTSTELAPHDPQLRKRLNEAEADKEAVFAAALRQAQQKGEIAADKDPQALARFLYNTVLGLRVRARRGPERETLQDIIDITLSVLD